MKKSHRLTLLLTLSLMLLPNVALAAACNNQDCSLYYLGQVFGQVGMVLPGTGNYILGALFKIYNMVVITLGSLVIGYTVVHATLTSAHEGDALGKKSPLWIPMRAAAGLGLLIPTANGYSLIQIFMMWIIVQGVNGANVLWKGILDASSGNYNLNTMVGYSGDPEKLSSDLFDGFVCMELLNSPTYTANGIVDGPVSIYEVNSTTLNIGVKDSPNYYNVCGTISASAFDNKAQNKTTWNNAQLNAVWTAYYTLAPYAKEAALLPSTQWSGYNVIKQGSTALKTGIANTPLKSTDSSETKDYVLQNALYQGWVTAGRYYFELSENAESISFTGPSFAHTDNPYPAAWTNAKNNAQAYTKATTAVSSQSTVESDWVVPTAVSDSFLQDVIDVITYPLSELVNYVVAPLIGSESIHNHMTTFKTVGLQIMGTTESIFWSLLIALPPLILLAALAPWANPIFLSIMALVVILVPLLMVLLGLLWSAGVFMGIYVPMVPFILYTFTALGYFLTCIESMIAAPIVALGMSAPGENAMGRASPAVLLITNVFLKPSLMLIGFVAAARLVAPIVGMINTTFYALMQGVKAGLMLFGSIAEIVIYVGILTAAIHQVFSLIYVIPDNILRWIGGHAQSSMAERALQEAQQYSETGAKASQQMMKGAMEVVVKGAKVAEKISKSLDKDRKERKEKKEQEAKAKGKGGGTVSIGRNNDGGSGGKGGGTGSGGTEGLNI